MENSLEVAFSFGRDLWHCNSPSLFRRASWALNRFTRDSFPPNALDDHVRIGGRYFDVINTEYTIDEIPSGSNLRVVMHYRVSTNFNWYVGPIAAFLVTNFERTALAFYARRAESMTHE